MAKSLMYDYWAEECERLQTAQAEADAEAKGAAEVVEMLHQVCAIWDSRPDQYDKSAREAMHEALRFAQCKQRRLQDRATSTMAAHASAILNRLSAA